MAKYLRALSSSVQLLAHVSPYQVFQHTCGVQKLFCESPAPIFVLISQRKNSSHVATARSKECARNDVCAESRAKGGIKKRMGIVKRRVAAAWTEALRGAQRDAFLSRPRQANRSASLGLVRSALTTHHDPTFTILNMVRSVLSSATRFVAQISS